MQRRQPPHAVLSEPHTLSDRGAKTHFQTPCFLPGKMSQILFRQTSRKLQFLMLRLSWVRRKYLQGARFSRKSVCSLTFSFTRRLTHPRLALGICILRHPMILQGRHLPWHRRARRGRRGQEGVQEHRLLGH